MKIKIISGGGNSLFEAVKNQSVKGKFSIEPSKKDCLYVLTDSSIGENEDDGINKDWIFNGDSGGTIVFSTDVNSKTLSDNRFINFLKQKYKTYKNRFSSMGILDKLRRKHDVYAWTIGKYLKGVYTGNNGKTFTEDSISIDIIGISLKSIIKIAQDICREFDQESVLVKDSKTGQIYFVTDDREETSTNESSTSRILQHFTDDTNLAIISPYRTERTEIENRKLLKSLKSKVREMGLGYSELISRWTEINDDGEAENSDERSLMIYGISKKDALELGKNLQQSSIIFKDEESCKEICTNGFTDYDGNKHTFGETVRVFNTKSNTPFGLDDAKKIMSGRMGGPASYPIKSNRPFKLSEMYEVESPRGSIFSEKERYIEIV